MPIHESVRSIRQSFNSGSGANDGIEFIRCVGGRQPEIHKVWTFGDNRLTPKVHPFVRVDVGAFHSDCFVTDYLAENGRRVPMYGRKLMNGSVKWLGVPTFFRNNGPPWADNILFPSPCWGVRGTYEILALESQPGGFYGGVYVLWCGAVPARTSYLPQSPENARATARCVCDNLLWDYRLAHAQIILDYQNILRYELFNQTDFALDDLWD